MFAVKCDYCGCFEPNIPHDLLSVPKGWERISVVKHGRLLHFCPKCTKQLDDIYHWFEDPEESSNGNNSSYV